MEALKALVEIVAALPQLVIWGFLALLAYKVVIVGSIYGVVRLLIIKTHDWAVRLSSSKEIMIGNNLLDESVASALKEQLERISGKDKFTMGDVQKLREALDAKL